MRSAVFEWGLRRGKDAGKLEGKLETEQHLAAYLFEKRLGRPLDEGERATLVRRLGTLGADRLIDLQDDLTPDALAAWLHEPDAA